MEAKIAKQHDFNRRNFTQVKRHALMVRLLQDPAAESMKLLHFPLLLVFLDSLK